MGKAVLATLRQQTRALHRQTEHALDLVRASATRAEYAALLERLLGFYEPLEVQLYARPGFADGMRLDLEARRKSPVLRNDLEILDRGREVPVQSCAYVPVLASDATLAGAWYVVEGATLGGQVIAAHLTRQLGLTPCSGAGFFDCYGEERQRRWDEYCAFLDSIPDAEAEQVAAGAVMVFGAMRRWLANRPRTTAPVAG